MVVSKKLFRFKDTYEASRFRNVNEYTDEEVHNDEVHGVKDDINYRSDYERSVENTGQIFW